MDKKWYILKTRNKYERKVAERVESYRTDTVYVKCLVPTEKVVDTSDGSLKVKEKLTYPGYVFIETNSLHGLLTEIKFIDGSQGFVKEKNGKISIMNDRDIKRIFDIINDSEKNIDIYDIKINDRVKIKSGVFENFIGNVKKIYDKDYVIGVMVMKKEIEVSVLLSDIEKVIDN